jgi:hypothetical protein
MHETLPLLAEKTKEKFIAQSFKSCNICTMIFYLWVSKGFKNSVFIVHFLNHNWELYIIKVNARYNGSIVA